jgi:hypothetical protein
MIPIDLARILRPFGISPATIRLKPFLTYSGCCSGGFKPLWKCRLDEKQRRGRPMIATLALAMHDASVTAVTNVTTSNTNRQ